MRNTTIRKVHEGASNPTKTKPKFSHFKNIALGTAIFSTVAYLNLHTRGFGLDLIILFFAILAAFKGKLKEFLKDWIKYLILFWAYETTRGLADNLGTKLHRPLVVDFMINLDKMIFHTVPTVFLQQHLPPAKAPFIFLLILFLFYTLFYWYWASVGYYLWLKNKQLFHRYMTTLIILSFASAIFYILMPSAPPWYAAYLGKLPPLDRFLWGRVFPSNGISFVHFWDQNYFAAFPSLHFAWPLLASLFLAKILKGKIKYAFFAIPFIICFAIVYGAEHYVADCLMGGVLAAILYFLEERVWSYKIQTKSPNSPD